MKRLIVSAILWIGLATALFTINPAPARAEGLQDLPPSVIDNIEVPYDVVMYAQLEHQGYAITKVSKTTRNGQQAYRLRVDRDSRPDDFSSIYLYYDKGWDLMDDSKMTAPETPDKEEKKDEKKKIKPGDDSSGSSDRPAYKPEPEVREPEDDDKPRKPEPEPAPTPTPEPTPEPEPEPTPEPEQPPDNSGASPPQ